MTMMKMKTTVKRTKVDNDEDNQEGDSCKDFYNNENKKEEQEENEQA